MKITISEAYLEDFELIKKYIAKFELDDRDLRIEQFVVAKECNDLLGFGRIRKHKGCDEFCSLGVIEQKRLNGIAKLLIEARIKIATQPIYLVTIIPEFFEPLGFKTVISYPPEIQDKLEYCMNELTVAETYVVMNYQKNNF
jgi:N-acetylglutamate synthase-like GNAT family acetyltransferase